MIPVFGAAALIYSASNSRFDFILTNKVFIWIGLILYSLYLAHWPIIVFYKYEHGWQLSSFEIILLLMLLIVVGFGMYKYIETPFRKKY